MRDPYCIEEDVRKRVSEDYLRTINNAEEQIKKVTADEEQGIQRYSSDNISIIRAYYLCWFQYGTVVFSAMYSLGEKIEDLCPYFDISVKGLENSYLPNSIREHIRETPPYLKIQERYQTVRGRDIFSSAPLSFLWQERQTA